MPVLFLDRDDDDDDDDVCSVTADNTEEEAVIPLFEASSSLFDNIFATVLVSSPPPRLPTTLFPFVPPFPSDDDVGDADGPPPPMYLESRLGRLLDLTIFIVELLRNGDWGKEICSSKCASLALMLGLLGGGHPLGGTSSSTSISSKELV